MDTGRVDINNVLMQMRALKAQAQNQTLDVAENQSIQPLAEGKAVPSFSDMLTNAVDNVHAAQKESGRLRTAFEMGEPDVDITQVMVASQKASVSFQAMTEVRNKLVKAYEDIMNMPV